MKRIEPENRTCAGCGVGFLVARWKRKRYCSPRCAKENLSAAEKARLTALMKAVGPKGTATIRRRAIEKAQATPLFVCKQCGESFPKPIGKPHKIAYCSTACVSEAYKERLKGENNPNYRGVPPRQCEKCGKDYRSYNKARRYCSHECYTDTYAHVRAARKDNNHKAIVEAIEKAGGHVLDVSEMGAGMPDLIVLTKRGIQLAEIKNPETRYGKQGLSKRQKRFASTWQGLIFIIRTEDEAMALARGDFEGLDVHGYGYECKAKPIPFNLESVDAPGS